MSASCLPSYTSRTVSLPPLPELSFPRAPIIFTIASRPRSSVPWSGYLLYKKERTTTYALTAVCESQLWLLSVRIAAFRSTFVKLMNCVIAVFCWEVYAGGIVS